MSSNYKPLFEEWLSTKTSYSDDYKSILRSTFTNHFESILPRYPSGKLTTQAVREILLPRPEISDYTRNVHYYILLHFFQYLTERGILMKNPVTRELNPKVDANRFHGFDHNQVLQIEAAIPNLPLGKLYGLCYTSGIDAGYLRPLVHEDIDGHTIHISKKIVMRTKCEQLEELHNPFEVTLDDTAFTFLPLPEQYASPSSLVFPNKQGSIITKAEITHNTRILKLLTGIENITLLQLSRHRRLSNERNNHANTIS